MRIKEIPSFIAIATSAVAHIIAANLVMFSGRVFKELFIGIDAELPIITSIFISYTASGIATYIGILLSLLFLAILFLAYRSAKSSWLFPLLLTVSFVVSLLLVMSALFAISLPLLRITSTMGN